MAKGDERPKKIKRSSGVFNIPDVDWGRLAEIREEEVQRTIIAEARRAIGMEECSLDEIQEKLESDQEARRRYREVFAKYGRPLPDWED